PGLVSNLYGFADSPDAEVIARGVAGKGPDAVALGRHANFFLWGFSGPPADMTPAAQRLFVNVISYMRQFDGQIPLVRSKARAREGALRFAAAPRFQSDDWRRRSSRSYRSKFQEHPEWIPVRYKGDIEAYIAELLDKSQESEAAFLKQVLPEPLRNKFA